MSNFTIKLWVARWQHQGCQIPKYKKAIYIFRVYVLQVVPSLEINPATVSPYIINFYKIFFFRSDFYPPTVSQYSIHLYKLFFLPYKSIPEFNSGPENYFVILDLASLKYILLKCSSTEDIHGRIRFKCIYKYLPFDILI